jgi:hypothetical protein
LTTRPNWLGISDDILCAEVANRLGVSIDSNGVDVVSGKIRDLSEELRDDFRSYWNTGVVNMNLTRGSWSIQKLVESRKSNVIAAFLDLDWIIRDPIKAEKSLNKGYYEFTPLSDDARKKADLGSRL